MERLVMWRYGNDNTAKITVVDDLSSWEMIDPSDEDDIQSLSFSESLSDKEISSDNERLGFDDDQKGDGQPGFTKAGVESLEEFILNRCDQILTDQRSGLDDNQNGDKWPGFKEKVTDYQNVNERLGFDDPDFGEKMVSELVSSQSNDQILKDLNDSSLVNQRWRFDEDGDEQPGFDEPNAGLGHSLFPENVSSPIDERWGFHDDQIDDGWPGFDEHSVGLWEYTVQLIGLDHVPSDPPSTPLMDEVSENQWSRLNDNKYYDERLISNHNDNEDDSDDAYEFDDNLVPFYASNRFGNQRMGKVGKKVNGKKYKRYK